MRFVCDSCRAQYMISDDKVGAKGVKVRCKKCGFVILVRRAEAGSADRAESPPEGDTNPLLGESAKAPSSGQADTRNNIFGGVDDDELGAVFDQALGGGLGGDLGKPSTNDLINRALGAPADNLDENDSTRVMDATAMKKLADASQEPSDPHGKAPAHEWFVAIDEKQSGPFSVERIKELWDRGEIGPDSLTWRAGQPDWQPMSEISELAAVLAPKPVKPVIVSPVSMVAAGGLMNAPAESAFNAGGMNKSVRTEVPVMTASSPEVGAWRPTAASALKALVQDEIDALARPSPSKMDAVEALPSRGLLDLPGLDSGGHSNGRATNGLPHAQTHDSGPQGLSHQSYVGPTQGYAGYVPPQPKRNTLMYVLGGVVGFAVLLLLGGFTWVLLTNRPSAPLPPQVVYMQAAQTTPAVAAKTPEAAPGKTPPLAIVPPAPTTVAVANPNNITAPNPDAIRGMGGVHAGARHARGGRNDGDPTKPPVVAAVDRTTGAIPDAVADDNAFDQAFGSEKKPEAKPAKSKLSVYVPPAPGAANMPDRLEQSDIMSVVLQNKPSIVSCVQEQKKREPGSGGNLVVRWSILPSGKVANVQLAPQSTELKGTYMATCISGLVKSFSFPRHKTQGDPIDFPFKF